MSNLFLETIKLIDNYKYSTESNNYLLVHPQEAKRRINYLNNLVYQLSLASRDSDANIPQLIMDDIQDVLAHDFYSLNNEENEARDFNEILRQVMANLQLYTEQLQTVENTRVLIQQYFDAIPNYAQKTIHSIEQIQHYIEENFSAISIATEQPSAKIFNQYQLCKTNPIELRTHYISHIINDTFSFSVQLEELNENAELSEVNDCIYQSYLEVALVLTYFQNEFQKLHALNDIHSVKLHIRRLCRLLLQIQEVISAILKHNAFSQKLVINFYQRTSNDSNINMIGLLRFIDRMALESLSLIENIKHLYDVTSVIFAYILDESVTRICKRDCPSRLEQLLNGMPFEPLSKANISQVYENYLTMTTSFHRHTKSNLLQKKELLSRVS